ncbi:MAG: Cys-Gln thioester bond-forming surface protein [Clostridia bacterium]|nr:Cys-Gln thioester bond-forming surface protein [Clostridia bacterium]
MQNEIRKSPVLKRIARIAAVAVSLLIILTAVNVPNGAGASAWTGRLGELTGYGGAEYYKKAGYYVNIYAPDGSVAEVRYKAGGSRQRVYYMTDPSSGVEQTAYCLASGLSFSTGAGYGSASGAQGSFPDYFSCLPEAARKGIAYASIYGFSEKTMSLSGPGPVEGTLGADFWVATQCIIWEYQQGIRTDAGLRRTNGLIESDNYFSIVKGKPAEKCYDHLLGLIRSASSVPTFASGDQSGWNSSLVLSETSPQSGVYRAQIYSRTTVLPGTYYVTDENGAAVNGLTFSVSGNTFTLTATRKFESGKRIIVRRTEDEGTEGAALFFTPGDPDRQTMLSTGGRLSSPFAIYLNIKTQENEGERTRISIEKTSSDGITEGIPFVYSWTSSDGLYYNRTVYTDANGLAETEFRLSTNPGDVRSDTRGIAVMEDMFDRYQDSVTGSSGNIGFSLNAYFYRAEQNGQTVWKFDYSESTAVQNSIDGTCRKGFYINIGYDREHNSIHLDYYNEQLKGTVKLKKTAETGSSSGFVFELSGQEPENEHIIVRKTTGSDGTAVWDELLPGMYLLKEILPENSSWEEPEPIAVTVEPNKTTEVKLKNVRKKGTLKIIKTADDDRFDGISFTVTGPSGFALTVTPDEDSIQIIDGRPAFVATVSGLVPGSYTVTEICPNRYKNQQPKRASVTSGNTVQVSFHNELIHVSLTVTKAIYAEEFVPAHGDATFTFEIRDVDGGRTYYRTVSFTEGDKYAGQTGIIIKTFTMTGLPAGTYEVTELKTLRYRFESLSVDPDSRKEQDKAIFTITSSDDEPWAVFVNRVVNQEKTSDTAYCENRFRFGD